MAYIYYPKVQSTSKLLTATLVFIYFLAAVILLSDNENGQEHAAKRNSQKPSYSLQAINNATFLQVTAK